MTMTCLLLAAALPAQAPADQAGPKPESAAERLEFMKASARAFRFHRGTEGAPFELQAEPAFRLGKQYTNVLEGANFFWLGDAGRPEAAVQVFKFQYAGGPPGGVWIHSFSSLSPGTFSVERDGRTVW